MTFVTHTCLSTVSKVLWQPGQHHPLPRIYQGCECSSFHIQDTFFVLLALLLFLWAVDLRWRAMAVWTCMGGKHPNVKKCAFMPALPLKTAGLDVDSGTLAGVRCWRQLLAVQGLQSGLEADVHAYLQNFAEQISHLTVAKAQIATVWAWESVFYRESLATYWHTKLAGEAVSSNTGDREGVPEITLWEWKPEVGQRQGRQRGGGSLLFSGNYCSMCLLRKTVFDKSLLGLQTSSFGASGFDGGRVMVGKHFRHWSFVSTQDALP